MALRVVGNRVFNDIITTGELAKVIIEDLNGMVIVGEDQLYQLTETSLQNMGYKINPEELTETLELLRRNNQLVCVRFDIKSVKFGMKYRIQKLSSIFT